MRLGSSVGYRRFNTFKTTVDIRFNVPVHTAVTVELLGRYPHKMFLKILSTNVTHIIPVKYLWSKWKIGKYCLDPKTVENFDFNISTNILTDGIFDSATRQQILFKKCMYNSSNRHVCITLSHIARIT